MNSKPERYGLEHGKCIACGACGDSACCTPLDCEMKNKSSHCADYLVLLKAGYTFYQKMFGLVYDNKEKYPQLYQEMLIIQQDVGL